MQKWKYDHAPEDSDQKKNHLWWRDRAERNNPTITESTGVDESRAAILQSIKEHTKRTLASPYRFSMAGNRVLGGVGQHQNKDVNFTFQATQPYGPTVGGVIENVMVSLDTDVESLLDTTDEFYPPYRQRLGFGIDPGYNRLNSSDLPLQGNGNKLAPFSLYESTVNSGYQSAVSSSYKGGVQITNLHHDFVANTDIPMQGPFTEKYVGGRAYRHTTINSGPVLDTLATRAEGFRINLGDHITSTSSGSLAVVPPNSGTTALGWDPTVPTAQRFRDETAKRPVNIRNIQMRTGSTILGNYERNYQVIQTSGRTLNDPYFQDQSFNFAQYPETLATRGRFPLFEPLTFLPSTVLFDGSESSQITAGTSGSWGAPSVLGDAFEGDGFTISFWVNVSGTTNNQKIVAIGDCFVNGPSWYHGISIDWLNTNSIRAEVYQPHVGYSPTKITAQSSADSVPRNTWTNVIVAVPGDAIDGSGGAGSVIYINGSNDTASSTTSAGVNWTTIDLGSTGNMKIGTPPGNLTGDNFTGFLCDVAVYRGVPDGSDAPNIYNSGTRPILTDVITGADQLTAPLSWLKLGLGAGDSVAGGFYNTVNNTDFSGSAKNMDETGTGSGIIAAATPPIAENFYDPGPLYKVTANPGGNLNYTLPSRTGSNSNQTVIVNRFAGCGYEVMSRGYMDPAHEELSVYNALPYRDLAIIDYGLSGSASADPLAAHTITVIDQIDKNRGLDQRAALHCGPFGSDAAYGTVPELTYVTVPSWHKTNRNRRLRIESSSAGYVTASVYDNLFVQHQIPRSEQQYAWITGSMISGTTIYGLDASSCISASTLSQLVTGATNTYYGEAYLQNFVGQAGRLVIDSTNTQTHLQYANEHSPLDVGTYSGKFDGSTYAYLGAAATWNAAIGGTNLPFTISMWLNTPAESPSGTTYIPLITFGGGSGSLTGQIVVWIDTATMTIRFQRKGNSGSDDGIVKSTSKIRFGTWYHVTVTYDGSNPGGSNTVNAMKVYVDGVDVTASPAVSELSSPDAIATNGGRIGYATNFSAASTTFLKGYLADVAIWSDDLSSANVTTLYNNRRPLDLNTTNPDSSDFEAWYQFSEFAGDSAATIINRASSALASTDASGSFGTVVFSRFSPNSVDGLSILLNNRGGAYGWPTWKQIRTGETPVATRLRRANQIGTVLPPPLIAQDSSPGRTYQYVRGKQANTFVDYTEQAVSSRYRPTMVCLEDNTEEANVANNLSLNISYGNMLDHFSNQGLNNRLNIPAPKLHTNALNTVFEYVTGSDLTAIIDYGERLYPAETNAYKNIIRRRTSFSITDIWNNLRSNRSPVGSTQQNTSQGWAPPDKTLFGLGGRSNYQQSVWPLDGHSDFDTTSSVLMNDGAGELMNSYGRYKTNNGTLKATPVATYAPRIPIGSSSVTSGSDQVYGGDSEYLVAKQANKPPYETYEEYSERLALVGKDHSLIPEFRISEHIETYIEQNESDFLTQLDNIFSLTGAALSDSSENGFYTTYSNSDFLKYFSVVDESLNNERPGDLKIKRDKLSLKCSGLLKFLPYKGFYPAERTLQLASIFSQSYGPYMTASKGGSTGSLTREDAWRTCLEPFYSPGIMYNTIKSGIACGYAVMANTASTMHEVSLGNSGGYLSASNAILSFGVSPYSASLFEGVVSVADGIYQRFNDPTSNNNGFVVQRLPFEALADPAGYLSESFLTGSGGMFDSGISPLDKMYTGWWGPVGVKLLAGGDLYKSAIDNFLCETNEFFMNGLAHFESNREDQFSTVIKDKTYAMRMRLYRTSDSPDGAGEPTLNTSSFNMYTRETAFGYPMIGAGGYPQMQHQTPPYWSGSAEATITFTAPYTGIPTLDDIFNNITITYSRDVRKPGGRALHQNLRQQIDSCFNMQEYFNDVPDGTVAQSKRWLIQSKFETPVINVAGVSQSFPPTSYTWTKSTNGSSNLPTSADKLKTTGLWHQYGSIPTGSNVGIFTVLDPVYDGKQEVVDVTTYRSTPEFTSLADIVGFQTGKVLRIGSVKKENILEEGIVAIPFRTQKNRRSFIDVSPENTAYANMEVMLEKYVFPPRFDFVRNPTVDPILMYTFEFSAKVTQKDIGDMWQNLQPDIASNFEQQDVVVEETELMDSLMNSTDDIRWMVFKVKKRAASNYNRYRRGLVTDDVSALSETVGDYSYNWPYDFFSLVELAKIDETVRYASDNLTPSAPTVTTRGAQTRASNLPVASGITVASTREAAPQVGTQTVAVAEAATPVNTPSPTKRRAKVAKPAKKSTKRRSTQISKVKKRR